MRGKIASFGPFRLHATERLLEKNGTALKIGSRALDILITLLEHAPEVVSKRDLIRRVWGQLIVDEVSLPVQVDALRKRLGDGDASVNYIINVPGRGYCFAGGVTWAEAEAQATPKKAPTAAAQLPREPLLMVGRDPVVAELIALLKKQRFVSIVGAGGIGKTTIALTLAHRLFAEFEGAVHFLDLGPIEDPGCSRVCSRPTWGSCRFRTSRSRLSSRLRDQRMLLVFDSCEHLIEPSRR